MTVLPIRVDDIKDAILDAGIQDQITFNEVEINSGIVRGFLHRYSIHSVPYADPTLCSDIYYAKDLENDWARLVCVKELVHIFDSTRIIVKTRDDVVRLVEQLSMPLDIDSANESDIKSISDRTGMIIALALLLPKGVRDLLRPKYEASEITEEEISLAACLPLRFVKVLMLPNIDNIVNSIIGIAEN